MIEIYAHVPSLFRGYAADRAPLGPEQRASSGAAFRTSALFTHLEKLVLDYAVGMSRTPGAARQLASRAHRRVQGAAATVDVRGASAIADTLSGCARFAQPALVNGVAGAVWAPGGRPRVVFGFTITRGKILAIDILADPTRLRQLNLAILDD